MHVFSVRHRPDDYSDGLTRIGRTFFGFLVHLRKYRNHNSFEGIRMNIYVGNLSFEATESDVETAFGEFGAVKSVNIVKDRESGRSRGFGFVEMHDRESGLGAIEGLNEQQIAGRNVTVNEARPRENSGGGKRW
jgi:RNA recognition motif-containing protein